MSIVVQLADCFPVLVAECCSLLFMTVGHKWTHFMYSICFHEMCHGYVHAWTRCKSHWHACTLFHWLDMLWYSITSKT